MSPDRDNQRPQSPRQTLNDTDFEKHVSALGERATLHWIEGADHGLDLPKRSGRDRTSVAAECAHAVSTWLERQSR